MTEFDWQRVGHAELVEAYAGGFGAAGLEIERRLTTYATALERIRDEHRLTSLRCAVIAHKALGDQ